MPDAPRHRSVLLKETISLLDPRAGERALDVTLGLGGHAMVMLERIGPGGEFVGLDADQENLKTATERLAGNKNIRLIHANFAALPALDLGQFDVILADLGLSSPHIDDASRGFTFRAEAPLDMRFDRTAGKPAWQMIRESDVHSLANVFRSYGELQRAMALANAVVAERPTTTTELVACAEGIYKHTTPRVLPQLFQALRIWVNAEMEALKVLLMAAPAMLRPGGRFAVIAYHSLEDRRVKKTFRALTTAPKDMTTGAESSPAPYQLLTPKGIRPGAEELHANSRSRSAILRVIFRV